MKNYARLLRNLDFKDAATNYNSNEQNYLFEMMRQSFPGWKVGNIIPFAMSRSITEDVEVDGFHYDDAGNLTGRVDLLYGDFNFQRANDTDFIQLYYPSNNGKVAVLKIGNGAATNVKESNHFKGLLSGVKKDGTGTNMSWTFVGWRISCDFTVVGTGNPINLDFAEMVGGSYPQENALPASYNLQPLQSVMGFTQSQITLFPGQTGCTFRIDIDMPAYGCAEPFILNYSTANLALRFTNNGGLTLVVNQAYIDPDAQTDAKLTLEITVTGIAGDSSILWWKDFKFLLDGDSRGVNNFLQFIQFFKSGGLVSCFTPGTQTMGALDTETYFPGDALIANDSDLLQLIMQVNNIDTAGDMVLYRDAVEIGREALPGAPATYIFMDIALDKINDPDAIYKLTFEAAP